MSFSRKLQQELLGHKTAARTARKGAGNWSSRGKKQEAEAMQRTAASSPEAKIEDRK